MGWATSGRTGAEIGDAAGTTEFVGSTLGRQGEVVERFLLSHSVGMHIPRSIFGTL